MAPREIAFLVIGIFIGAWLMMAAVVLLMENRKDDKESKGEKK